MVKPKPKRKTRKDILDMLEVHHQYAIACHIDEIIKEKLEALGVYADVTKLMLLNITKYKKIELGWTKLPHNSVWMKHHIHRFPEEALPLIDRMVANWLFIKSLEKPLP